MENKNREFLSLKEYDDIVIKLCRKNKVKLDQDAFADMVTKIIQADTNYSNKYGDIEGYRKYVFMCNAYYRKGIKPTVSIPIDILYENDPKENVDKQEICRNVRIAIAKLPKELRKIAYLRYIKEETLEQISNKTNMTKSGVHLKIRDQINPILRKLLYSYGEFYGQRR